MDNFRGIYKTIRVAVLEGRGTVDSPFHVVNYVYDADTYKYIGQVSMASENSEPGKF